jgi:dTDP-4-dehydrorhamnose reductase
VKPPLEIWASPEPTVARIAGAEYRDQLTETGHEARDGDIDLIAALGVAATRYPVLWEKTVPSNPAKRDFTWARRRLEALRAARVEPIVTLLHHGSGPPFTSLVDPAFPELFAAYAGAVAAEFPWVMRWTPINEPLTTARFATLYGHWHPHGRDDHVAFGQAITNQALAIQLAMGEIRRRIPAARLVVTEDLQGFRARDARLRDDAEHKRDRSFLSLELLMGRVVAHHPMRRYLLETCNVSRTTLDEIAERATPPDLVGWNYYPYSERTLVVAADGSWRNRATIEVGEDTISPRPLLRVAHERLGLSFALSEVHVDAPQSERVDWLLQRYDDACALLAEGLPVRAVGAWAAFGLVDWRSLLTRRDGHAEDGVYTFARPGETPRPTAVADAVRALALGYRRRPDESGTLVGTLGRTSAPSVWQS